VLRGNGARYASLLRRFAGWHGADADQIAQALAQGDERHVRQLAHALRGAAGTIGATAIAAEAAELEQVDPTAPDAMARRHQALAALRAGMAALAQALDGPG
jgi:HPt (histidine-containing phosphotransfer) domain-containing protein